jgi:hypothetical protein
MCAMRYVFLLCLFMFACEKDQSPLSSESISIIPISMGAEDHYTFKVINNLDKTIWYSGYQQGSPIYATQIISDTGWVYSGPGWCGTGLTKIEFRPGSSFTISVLKPDTDREWRVGIYYYYHYDDNGEYLWSRQVK